MTCHQNPGPGNNYGDDFGCQHFWGGCGALNQLSDIYYPPKMLKA